MKQNQPPQWIIHFFTWICKEELLDAVLGDLLELYERRVKHVGQHRANWLFLWNVLCFLQPFAMKKLEGQTHLNNYGMFKNHIKTSFRSIRKNAWFSGINIVGLAISMSVGLLMIIFLSELYSFDQFHEHKDHLYRVTTKVEGSRGFKVGTSSYYIGQQLQEGVAGVEKVLVLRNDLTADLKIDEHAIAVKGYYATASFFEVFSFELLKGNPASALSNPGSIVLTQSTANKLFGEENPLGKTMTVEGNQDFQTGIITGVIADPPVNSHIDFDVLAAMKTVENSPVPRRRGFKNDPEDCWSSYVYLVLSERADFANIEAAMEGFMETFNARWDDTNFTHSLQPLSTFVTDPSYRNLPGPTFAQSKIYIMAGLTLVVLLSACFNYTNLSFARALRRFKEIGVRKVNGAGRFQIFSQFITEAVIMSLIALIIGFLLFILIKPRFLELGNPTTSSHPMFSLDITGPALLYFIAFALIIGVAAGLLPALLLSKLKANALFGEVSRVKVFTGMSLRKVLSVFQFTLAIGLIMFAVVVHKQYQYVMDYDLGFETENIIQMEVDEQYLDLLTNEFDKLPEVMETSRSSGLIGLTGRGGFAIALDRSDTITFMLNNIDGNYLPMHGLEIIAGSGFTTSLKEGQGLNYVVVDEQFLKALNLGSPEESIGRQVWHQRDEDVKMRIIGVVKDFVKVPLNQMNSEPMVFMQKARSKYYRSKKWFLNVKIQGVEVLATINKLADIYEKIDPLHPFQAKFYDDQLAQNYSQYRATYEITSFLALLAISISSFGLLGMAVFNTESRMKEISIRKVLGAGIGNLSTLLSKGFIGLMLFSGLVAIPLTYYLVITYVLNEFAYRTNIGPVEIMSGLIMVLLIGLLTIGWHIRLAIIQNPADILRKE
ncbi:MAG: ABC transporter permease [Cytophagales bacterium]|nr:ABC transporter permease [Cytophagales bacterium]